MTAPRRRWSFSLRTQVAVVTVVSLPLGWLGYHLNWIRERHDAREAQLSLSKMGFNDSAPWPLHWLGETGLPSAVAEEPEATRLRALFPEAEIVVKD